MKLLCILKSKHSCSKFNDKYTLVSKINDQHHAISMENLNHQDITRQQSTRFSPKSEHRHYVSTPMLLQLVYLSDMNTHRTKGL